MNRLSQIQNDNILKLLELDFGQDRVLSNLDIDKIAPKYLSDYLGTFSQDNIPINTIKNMKRASFIFNTDKSNQKGEHWIACVYQNNQFNIYDSFGRQSKELIPFFYKQSYSNGLKVRDSVYDTEQKDIQKNCGLRCIAWLIYAKRYGILKALKI